MLSRAPLAGLRVLHFGHFDPAYSRNRIVAKALRRAGAEVQTLTDPRSFAWRTPALVRESMRSQFDAVLVGFPGHADVALAKALGGLRHAPVLFDAFVSLQETADDRGRARSGWPRRRVVLEDHAAFQLADVVLVDTDTHGEHFVRDAGARPHTLRRLWVGADDDVMQPHPEIAHDELRVFVYASFIPLHGLEHVVRAASILERRKEPVRIDVVGAGATEGAIRALANELRVDALRFLGRRPYEELPSLMANSDVCLGIFGTSAKASRVIPNKVFDALACARAVITRESPAVRELLTPGTEVLLCPPGDPEALADAIVALHDDDLRRAIAARGHARFGEVASLDVLAHDLAAIVGERT